MIPRWILRGLIGVVILQCTVLVAAPVWDWWCYRRPNPGVSDRRLDEDPATETSDDPPSPATTAQQGNDAGRGILVAVAPPPAHASGRLSPSAPAGTNALLHRTETLRPLGSSLRPGGAQAAVAGPSDSLAPAHPSSTGPDREGPATDPKRDRGATSHQATTRPGSDGVTSLVMVGFPPKGAPSAGTGAEGTSGHNSDGSTSANSGTASVGSGPADDVARPDGVATLSVVPSRTALESGQTVRISVLLRGAQDVRSVPFHLLFNPDVLEYVGATQGPVFLGTSLQPILLASVNSDRPGDLVVGLSLVPASGLLNSSGAVAVLEFRAKGTGLSDLSLDRAHLMQSGRGDAPLELSGSTLEVR